MSGCTNPKYEAMLHAFELGMLPEEDRDELQVHLLECDHCFEKASKMQQAAALLRDDPDVRIEIDQLSKKKLLFEWIGSKARGFFAPQNSRYILLKPLFLLCIILIILYPVYRFGFHGSSPYIQTINLLPMRGGGENTIFLEKGGDAVINFVCENAKPGTAYIVQITAPDGDTLYLNRNFTGFSEAGMGSLKIPISKFSRGDYRLTISDGSKAPPKVLQEYYFRAQ